MNTAYAPLISEKPVSTFLKPAITSWIQAPYEQVSIDFKPVPPVCQSAALPVKQIHIEPGTSLENFDVSRLAPELKELAGESNLDHVQKVIHFLQKGGESIKTFGKIFLNDISMQKAVLESMMGDTGSAALNQLDNLQKEFALRLAACVQAREVAQLILASC